jgi:hypothetical protein
MLKITDDNYQDYKKVFEILWVFEAKRDNLDPNSEYSPLKILTNWEKRSKSIAKKGLKIGLTDSITMSMDMSTEMKNEINDNLIIKGLPGYYQLISIIKDTFQKVLKRGKVKSLDEYYILKELLDDPAPDVSEEERTQIFSLLNDFETNYVKKGNG